MIGTDDSVTDRGNVHDRSRGPAETEKAPHQSTDTPRVDPDPAGLDQQSWTTGHPAIE